MKQLLFILLGISLTGNITSCKDATSASQKAIPKSLTSSDSLIHVGKSIAKLSFTTLSQHLNEQLKDGGINAALTYCNVNAITLTDSLSKIHNVQIKRIAEKYRNESNALSKAEKLIFDQYKNKDLTAPQLVLNNKGNHVFYAPIKLKPMCVMCHGTKDQIGENYELISSLYPNDKATGFIPQELRGMWSITFN